MSQPGVHYGPWDNFLFWLSGLLGAFILRLMFLTVRTRVLGEDNLARGRNMGPGPLSFAIWHNRLLGHCWHNRGEGVCVLSSQHRDSEYIVRIVLRLGFYSVRGSATRGGVRGLLAILRAMREGHDLALTVDGPRGPAGVVKPGVIYAASRSGCPLLPTALAYSSCWSLKTWDRLRIPKPFSRMVIVYGEPIPVPKDLPDQEIDQWCLQLAEKIDQTAARADNLAREIEYPGGGGRLKLLAAEFLTRPRDRWYHLPLLAVLLPFEFTWRFLWRLREIFYQTGVIRATQPPVPAVCLGSLAAGGASKTPAALLVAGFLKSRGCAVGLLTRGYGRDSAVGGRMYLLGPESPPPTNPARLAGDEAALLARKLPGLRLAVGADRRQTARAAVEQLGARVLVLDDGFGHRRFGRSLDLLLVTPRLIALTAHTLPAGYLREPLAAIDRARAILLVQDDGEPLLELPECWHRDKPVIHLRRRVLGLLPLSRWPDETQGFLPAEETLRGMNVLAVCGIAHPEGFRDTLAAFSPARLETLAWPDHYPWTEDSQRLAAARAKESGALIVTTEKDAVKLGLALIGGDCLVLCLCLEDRSQGALEALLDELVLPAVSGWRRES